MIRLYLDWNVINQLKSCNTHIDGLRDFINSNGKRLCIPYSDAHLKDLCSGLEKSQQYISGELKHLAEVSRNNYMRYDPSSYMVEPFLVHPSEAFEDFKESYAFSMSIDDVLDNLDSESDMKIGEMIRCGLKILPNPHFMKEFPVGECELFSEMTKSISNSPSYYHLIKAVSESNNQAFKDPAKYKRMRQEMRTGFLVRPDQLSTADQPMERIDSEFQRMSGNSDVGIMKAVEAFKKDYPQFRTWLTDFFTIYCTLDFMGYHSDKINKKNKPENLFTDIMHTFYGAHCDFYISCDIKAIAKASQVYKELRISTKATTPEIFLEEVARMDFEQPTIQDLVDKVSLTLHSEDCFLREIDNGDLPDARVYVFKPQNAILSYFNFLQYYKFNDHYQIHLLHVNKNCSRFIFYDEIERIVDMFVNMLGADVYSRQEVTPEELSKLDSFERLWIIDTCIFSLKIGNENLSVLCMIYGSHLMAN